MNAQVEEAVLHESERVLKWGWFGGRRGFYATWPRCRSRTWALGGHVATFTPLILSRHHAKNQDDPHQESPRGI
jgi:hypothetical protein